MYSARCEAVRRAAHIIKDHATLCALLGVSLQQLRAWLEGCGSPTVDVFLKAVDIIDVHSSGDVQSFSPRLVGRTRQFG